VVSVENDLAQIAQDIQDSEQIIQRLEAVLATNDHLTIYPLLAARRMRIAGIEHDLIGIRNELAEQALRSGGGSPETGNRRALAQQYAAVGDPERAHGERTGLVQQEYDRIGDNAQEVEGAIMSTQAMAVALRTYALTNDKPDLQKQIDDVSKDAQAIEDELRTIDREIVLGKDLAAVGDEDLKRARELRRRLKAAQDAEQRSLAGKISPLADQAARIASSLEQTDDQIDKLVGQGIDEVKRMLTQERTNIAEYKKLLAEYEQESRSIGSDVLGFSFKAVKAKLYDIYIRSDVGNIDVTWSKKEDTNDDLKRLNLARARDLKQIRDEFKFILDENVPAPALRPQKTTLPPASQEGATSPDKGGGTDQRVKPAGDQTKDKTQPSVKPDATDTKATTPKATPKKKTTTKTTTPKKTGGTP
jgi:hypothetical protein